VWLWPGHAAYLGPALRLDAHSGSVHCFALGIDEAFTVHAAGVERRARSAFIPARTRHRIVGTGRMLFFYLDPGSAADGLLAAMTDRTRTIAYDHHDETDLAAPDPVQLRRTLGCDVPGDASGDQRIRLAMRILLADPANPRGAAELAAEVNLSTSRFLHLFSATAGTSFRRYRLWARMLHVAVAVDKGLDFTRAATEAGFSSSNHFSDAFHAMFGLTPSALLAGGTRFVVER
jgi:AraC-like DNA-binding protein